MAKITINQDSLKARREFKRHAIQPGHNIYRILPPFGDELVHNNYPYKRWSIVWMTDFTTGRRKPYALPPFEKGVTDPISTYLALLAKKIETVRAAMIEKGVPEDTVREKLADLNKLIWELRPKAGFYYNACNKAGEVGILELKKTAHDALRAEMNQYIKDYSQDPTSLSCADDDSGVWFDIIRTGEKGDKNTEYSVKKSQSKRKDERGKLIFEDDREALPEHIAQNFSTIGYDVFGLYQPKTHEELTMLLMTNLREIVKTIPAAKVDGFDPDKFDFTGVAHQEEIPFAPTPAVVAPAKPVVKLVLKEVDPVDEFDSILGESTPVVAPVKAPAPVVQAQPVRAAAPAPKPQQTDDIFALADSILNG
jgi:hypothetical protein